VETKALDGVRAAIAKHGLTYNQLLASPEILASFFGEDEGAPLPATFVFDADGVLRRAFPRPVQKGELDVLLESLLSEPAYLEDVLQLARYHLSRNEIEDALTYFKMAVEIRPDEPRTLSMYGGLLARNGRAAESIRPLEKAAKLAPDASRSWLELGLARAATGDYPGAVKDIKRAAAGAPRDVETRMTLGMLYARMEKLPEATRELEAVTKLAPERADGWVALGVVQKRRGLSEADRSLRRALELDPTQDSARKLLQQGF
jgi:Flp pilus assembly protein TadD